MVSPTYTSGSASPPRSRTPDDEHRSYKDSGSSTEECSAAMDTDYDCVPLDLSVNGGRLSPGLRERDSGTESDDSGGRCTPEGGDCKAYKKSLMKRYCKCLHL